MASEKHGVFDSKDELLRLIATCSFHQDNDRCAWGAVEIEDWDVSQVTDMKLLFHGGCDNPTLPACRALPYFNRDIGHWNVASVTTLEQSM